MTGIYKREKNKLIRKRKKKEKGKEWEENKPR